MEIENTNSTKATIDGELLEIIPLGGGREVGRSCILIRFKGKLIMVKNGWAAFNLASLTVGFTLRVMICLLCHSSI
jgi:predicted metal-dependent RNase